MPGSALPKPPVHILLVEDNEIDVEAVTRAFRKTGIACPLHTAYDGVEALAMLRGSGLSQPFLLLLDINMPRMDGIQLLQELRRDDALKHTIVFMLTTSGRSGDRMLAYEQNVAGYFLKENLETLTDTLKPYCRGNEFPDAEDG